MDVSNNEAQPNRANPTHAPASRRTNAPNSPTSKASKVALKAT